MSTICCPEDEIWEKPGQLAHCRHPNNSLSIQTPSFPSLLVSKPEDTEKNTGRVWERCVTSTTAHFEIQPPIDDTSIGTFNFYVVSEEKFCPHWPAVKVAGF